MSVATPFEKRREKRVDCEDRGFFQVEGTDQVLLRLRDVSQRGVGAYTRVLFNRGAVGTLSAKLLGEDASRRRPFEVVWCAPTDDEAQKLYPYRVGLRVANREVEIPKPERPGADKAAAPAARPAAGRIPVDEDCPYRIKGSMLTDFARLIRDNHDKPWQNFVTFEDMKIINGMIIPAAWYPLGVFRRAAVGVHHVFGKGRPESAKKWGRDMVEKIPSDLYRSFFDKNDPKLAAKNYVGVNMRVFDFMRLKYHDGGAKACEIAFTGDAKVKEFFPEIDLIGLLVGGALESLAEKNGAAAPASEVREPVEEKELLRVGLVWK